jgi:hypothetical protein
MNETPTDTQLKQALAKMLPEKVYMNTNGGQMYHRLDGEPQPKVLDGELLGLCHLVEETLNPAADKVIESNTPNIWRDYVTRLDDDCYKNGGHSCVHANWQQRTTALAKVLGVEL